MPGAADDLGHRPVQLVPADPLDDVLGAAFDDHQRRTVHGRRLLGPDAAGVAVALFRALGAEVMTRPSPWRLTSRMAALTTQWLEGSAPRASSDRS